MYENPSDVSISTFFDSCIKTSDARLRQSREKQDLYEQTKKKGCSQTSLIIVWIENDCLLSSFNAICRICERPLFTVQEKMTESEKDKFGIWSKVGRDQEVWALNWERGGFRNLGAGSEMVPNGTNQVARYLDTIISMMPRYDNQHARIFTQITPSVI